MNKDNIYIKRLIDHTEKELKKEYKDSLKQVSIYKIKLNNYIKKNIPQEDMVYLDKYGLAKKTSIFFLLCEIPELNINCRLEIYLKDVILYPYLGEYSTNKIDINKLNIKADDFIKVVVDYKKLVDEFNDIKKY